MSAASNRLPTLADEIRAAHAAVQRGALAVAERAIAAGHALIEAKKLLPHGQWAGWLADHAGCSERTARRYMAVARSGLKTATVADLGLAAAAENVSGEKRWLSGMLAIWRRGGPQWQAEFRRLAQPFGRGEIDPAVWAALAAIPHDEFERAVSAIKATGQELSAAAVLRMAAGGAA